jgi:helix-turn-helix protein
VLGLRKVASSRFFDSTEPRDYRPADRLGGIGDRVAVHDDALRLRLALELHGLSQRDVALAAGVNYTLVSHWVSGRRQPTAAARAAIDALLASRPVFRTRA